MTDPDWEILGGGGLVVMEGMAALVVDLSSVECAEDLVDLVNAISSQDPVEAMGFVGQRLVHVRFGVAVVDDVGATVCGSPTVLLRTATAWEPLTDQRRLTGGFAVTLAESAQPVPPTPAGAVGPVRSGAGFCLGMREADPWWSEWAPGQTQAVDAEEASVRGDLPTGPVPVARVVALVDDSGARYLLRRGVVAGRQPQSHAGVVQDRFDPLVLDDPGDWMSRVHFVLEVSGEAVSVSDVGSRHGTFVQHGPSSTWHRLAAGERRDLEPGDHIRAGGRTLRFDRLREHGE